MNVFGVSKIEFAPFYKEVVRKVKGKKFARPFIVKELVEIDPVWKEVKLC